MAESRGDERSYISISSSSSGGDDEEEKLQSESESEKYDASDDDECDEISASISYDDDESHDEEDESDDENNGESADLDNDEYRCNRVIRLLRERSDLQELNLKDCRAYIRKHGLRITGTKAECIQRVMEHWRIRDGNAEALYPRSSFTINCTGDVCKGDAVLFMQKVYNKFDKVTRSGTSTGRRTVAGRVVKESYGATKQQHTFTIEVLWSKGLKKLPPLFPLLVKGRNLYKLKTFRQRWKNEAERQKVLAEKHKRGAAARLVRAKMKAKKACPKNGVKHQKHFHPTGKNASDDEKGKRANRCGKAPKEHAKSSNRRQKAPPVAKAKLKNSYPRTPRSSRNHQIFPHPNQFGYPRDRTYSHSPQNFHQSQIPLRHQWSGSPFDFPPTGSSPFDFPPTGSSSSRMGFSNFRPYVDSHVMLSSEHQGSNCGFYPHHAYSHPSRVFEPVNLNQPPQNRPIFMEDCQNHFKDTYEQRR